MSTRLPPVRHKSISPPALHKCVIEDVERLDKNALFQQGRSYVVTGTNIPHHLPSPNKLRPFMDRKAGEVETWPAGNDTMQPDSQLASKPKLLQKLENYLQKELRALGCQHNTLPSEKRLQPFREVFEYIIENFRTYKPILSAVKHEYESMLQSQKSTIDGLEPLKAMLVNMNEQCEQKILHIKQDEKQELIEVKQENAKLENTITSLRDEIFSLQQQVKKCQAEIGIEYQKYRDESDARKLLIQDINDLKYQQEEMKKALSGSSDNEEGKKEDAVILRIALGKAREELAAKTQKLTEVLSDYGDVVPRREYENLEKKYQVTHEEFEELKKSNNHLHKEHSALIDVHKKVIEQRDGFALDCERMRQSATPRPDWDKCGLYVEGGDERWKHLTTDSSTGDKLDILLAEMTGQDVSVIKSGAGIVDYFEPKGAESSVPAYLHSTERVRNRRLNKRDLLIMIKDIWTEKINNEGPHPLNPARTKMVDYLSVYLKKRFGIDSMVTEWGYNIHDAMTRYSFDSKVSNFTRILNDELDEETHYMGLSRLEGLFKVLVKNDSDDNSYISKQTFHDALRSHFSYLDDDDVKKMVDVAMGELGEVENDQLPYKDLFTEDDEGKMGPFISSIIESHEKDKEKIIQEIELIFERKTDITKNDLTTALQNIDQKLNDKHDLLNYYISMGLRETGQDSVDKQSLINNLRRSCIGHSS